MIGPQAGKQTEFLSSTADIVLYGGAAGGGKTYGLLLEAIRYIGVRNFNAVIFRSQFVQIMVPGGLWDTAGELYPKLGGRSRKNPFEYSWARSKARVAFHYLGKDRSKMEEWQGSQIALICFDELTHFTKSQFFYMLSRNRSTCGVKPYIRATTNPDPDSWVREFIDWWIGPDGYAIDERSGVIRWFVHQNDQIFWFDSEEDAKKDFPTIKAKSFTFIHSNLHDNKILMDVNPDYEARLKALSAVDQERFLLGNWDIRAQAGDYFNRGDFEVVDVLPAMVNTVRCWDLAGTKPSEVNPDPDWTVGIKAGVDNDGVFYIIDVVRERLNPAEVKDLLINIASQDGYEVSIRIPQDPGSAGKVVAFDYVRFLAGYSVRHNPVTGNKISRATPASGQAGAKNIKVLRARWNDVFFNEIEGFPDAKHDDIVDALSDCIEELAKQYRPPTFGRLKDFLE